MNKIKHHHKAILIAFLGFASFSISDTSSKWLTQSYDVIPILWGISAFSLCFIVLISPLFGGLKPVFQTSFKKVHFLRSLCNTIISLLVIVGFAKLPLATTYTFIFMAPFFASLLAIPVFKERVEKPGLIAIVLGFMGVMVILRPGLEGFNPWFFAPLLSSIFIACLFLLARPLDEKDPVLCLGFYPALFNVIVFGPVILLSGHTPMAEDFIYFALSGIFVAGGLTGLGIAFRIGRAAVISSFQYTQMVWAILLGYFIFGDLPDLWTLVGAAIIISSGIYLIKTEHKSRIKDLPH